MASSNAGTKITTAAPGARRATSAAKRHAVLPYVLEDIDRNNCGVPSFLNRIQVEVLYRDPALAGEAAFEIGNQVCVTLRHGDAGNTVCKPDRRVIAKSAPDLYGMVSEIWTDEGGHPCVVAPCVCECLQNRMLQWRDYVVLRVRFCHSVLARLGAGQEGLGEMDCSPDARRWRYTTQSPHMKVARQPRADSDSVGRIAQSARAPVASVNDEAKTTERVRSSSKNS